MPSTVLNSVTMFSPPVLVDEPLELIDLLAAQFLAVGEGGQEPGQGAVEGLVYKFPAAQGVELLPGQQGGHRAPLVAENAPLTQPPQNGIGGGFFPVQRFPAQLHQPAGGERLVIPDQVGKGGFYLAQFVLRHVVFSSHESLQLVVCFEFTINKPNCQEKSAPTDLWERRWNAVAFFRPL